MLLPTPLDHVLGRPSVKFRKTQVFAVVTVWLVYLTGGNSHGPPGIRRISSFLSRHLSAWQTLVTTLLTLYTARNFGKLVGLECPEPLAGLYKPAFLRATWVTTALDAGFWSAMHIKRKPLRDISSVIFTLYYLICAEQADEKVRKIRAVINLEHLRISWNKPLTPYLGIFTKLMRPRLMRYQPRAIRIARPSSSLYTAPVHGWLYYEGAISALKQQNKVVLHVPGGGFVAMSPRTHDDALMAWAGKTGLPVLSLDYRKAPEYPYPYALDECFDVYRSIVQTAGTCIGLSGNVEPSIVVCGDSAGGNLAAAMTIKVLETSSSETYLNRNEVPLPIPDGLVLIYPSLDVNIGNWMSEEQMALIRGMRKTNRRILSRKNSEYHRMDPTTPMPTDDEAEAGADDDIKDEVRGGTIVASSSSADSPDSGRNKEPITSHQPSDITTPSSLKTTSPPRPITRKPASALTRTKMGVPSLLSYVSDRILTPEMLRTMILLYIGPHTPPNFSTDYHLSPALAPDHLLERFPSTYFLTGERDPLVDDTVLLAGRLRRAKRERRARAGEDEKGRRGERIGGGEVHVKLLKEVSHGFLQMCNIFPEAWEYVFMVGGWYRELFDAADQRRRHDPDPASTTGLFGAKANRHPSSSPTQEDRKGGSRYHYRTNTASSAGTSNDEDDDAPLEIGGAAAASARKRRYTRTTTNGKPPRPLTSLLSNGTPRAQSHSQKSRRTEHEEELLPHSLPNQGMQGEDGTRDEQEERKTKKRRSMVSLGSEDDFLGRRMGGIVGVLTRRGPD